MNKNIIWVKIKSKKYYDVIMKLNEIGVDIYDNKKINDFILIKTNYSDYKKIKKYMISYKISVHSNSGIYKVKDLIKKYLIFSLSITLGIFLLFIINNMIFKVEVKSNNKDVITLLENELRKNNLGVLKLKKNHNQVEKIVEKILNNNKDILEWIEIKYEGLVLIVNVTEKNVPKEVEKYEYCNIVSKTDAKIISMNVNRGSILKEINDYVLKGDIILSGDIIHNEEVKNTVCATGEIYGEVWYTVKVTVPLSETNIKYTGKSRYNLSMSINENEYIMFKSRIENKKNNYTNLYKLNDFEINLVKEKEYYTYTKKLTEEEAYKKAVGKAVDKVKLKLNKEEEIIMQKVLKKEVNDSTIYLEIFIVTKENIGQLQILEKEETNDNKFINENNQ